METDYADWFGPGSETISRYVDILRTRGLEWGLLGPREGDRLWDRHVLNSVAGASLIAADSSVVDVGSGAGLPGLPLAIARPDLSMTLLEPLARRVSFLELAVKELGLAERVRVVRGRAEDHAERYDVVASRAVAALPKLLPWCLRVVGPDGVILALKGESAGVEVTESSAALRKLGVTAKVHELTVPVVGDRTWVVEARATTSRRSRDRRR